MSKYYCEIRWFWLASNKLLCFALFLWPNVPQPNLYWICLFSSFTLFYQDIIISWFFIVCWKAIILVICFWYGICNSKATLAPSPTLLMIPTDKLRDPEKLANWNVLLQSRVRVTEFFLKTFLWPRFFDCFKIYWKISVVWKISI